MFVSTLKNHFHELNRHREADFENQLLHVDSMRSSVNPEIHMGSLWVEDPSLCAMVKVVAFYWAWEKSTHLLIGILIMGPYKPRPGLGLMSLSPIMWK